MPIQWSGRLTSPDQLASVIQGESATPEGQFAVASTMFNREQGLSGFNGVGAGSNDITQVVTPTQFNGYNVAPSPYATSLANDLWNGGAPQGGDTGNATFFAAPVQGNAAWAAPGGPLFDPVTGGTNIGGNYFSDVQGAPTSNFQEPVYAGTANDPLPGLTAADYGGAGSTDYSAGVGSIGSTQGQFAPGLVGSDLNSGNAIAGSNLSQYGFGTGGASTGAETSYANIPGQYGTPDVSTANAGTGQYSGGGFQETSPGSGFARVTPDGSNAVATTNTSPSTYGGAVTAGPGMPVADQGLATAASNAGTSISQAISGPESSSIKQAGQDVTTAGQTVSSGVNQAANTVSSTGVGILAGIEKYVGEFFLYGAVLVVGVIFLAIGLSKFGGPKVQVARA